MPVVKGGVWTNAEDEILKASVSKYGLNQWARVSSLLQRKTPKQCKARWSEWLDPSIKKIEWSKEEDERLLHLAKLMPTQWRTIAPLVGRTANQCLERYQQLLDEAEQRESGGLGLTGSGGEAQAPTADDVRRLRPGEVDPTPETKPAKPDTVDLDEDEKEMLSEARARLANTQGKKAKRKARERQQEESRRLAALQKRRELKTAGINIKVVTRKQGQMDYNADIPFEKAPAPGFYDTSEEQFLNERERANFDPKKQQLANNNKRKGEGDEDGDRKKQKKDKDAPSASVQAAIKAGQMQKIRQAEQSSKRRPLNLPAPQVSEGELEDMVKMAMMGERANTIAQANDNDATKGLVSTYSKITTQTPIRTPMAPAQEDHIANEIRNIQALNNNESALLGGENADLREGSASTGFDGATPRRQVMATPNPLATPLRNGMNGLATPGRATPGRLGQTPLRTPRDNFSLNAGGVRGAFSAASQLKKSLSALPKPKATEWDMELPEDQEEITTVEETEEDAEERDRRERAIQAAQAALERKRRTQVMQRGLPRPDNVHLDTLLQQATLHDDPAESMIAREMALLVANDAVKFPLPGSTTSKQPPLHLPHLQDDDLTEARLKILLEARNNPPPDPDHIIAAFDHENANALLLGLGTYLVDEEDDSELQKSAMQASYDAVQDETMDTVSRCAGLEKKLALHLGGYQQRAKTLRQKVADATDAFEKATTALSAFRTLANSEEIAGRNRLEVLRAEVAGVTRREREAQEVWKGLREELEGLREMQKGGLGMGV